MPVTLPDFNLLAEVSTGAPTPSFGTTWSLTSAPVQRYVYSRRDPDAGLAAYWGKVYSQFRFEPTYFYSVFTPNNLFDWDIGYIECPSGSGLYFRVIDWDVAHEGFTNEYPVVWAFRCNPDGYPMYSASANRNFWSPTPPQQYGPYP